MHPDAWLTCRDPDVMLAALRGRVTERELRLFAVACHRHVNAATPSDLRVVLDDAAAVWFAEGVPCLTRAARRTAGGRMTRETDPAARLGFVVRTRPDFYRRVAGPPRDPAALCDLLRDIVGDPFTPLAFDTSWLTRGDSQVSRVAWGLLTHGRLDELGVLADALEDAGCDNIPLLQHLRSPVPHARGCWALDLCSGRRLVHGAILGGDGAFLAALVRVWAGLGFIEGELAQYRPDRSPLTLAVEVNQPAAVRVLLDAGAKPWQADPSDQTPLNLAAQWDRVELARLLVAEGAEDCDSKTNTPLQDACERGHLEFVRLLLDAGADVNSAPFGRSPLMLAAERGDLPLVQLLVERGADVRARSDTDGESAYSLAFRGKGTDQVTQYLRRLVPPEEAAEDDEMYWQRIREDDLGGYDCEYDDLG